MSTSVSPGAPAGFNFTRDVVEPLAHDHDRRALTYVGADGVLQRMTFAELAADAARWAHLLRGRGHAAGERVLVLVGATPEWAPIMLGTLKAGLVAVPCPVGLQTLGLAERATRTGASVVVAAPEARAAADALRGMLERELDVVGLDEAPSLLARCRPVAPTEPRQGGDPAFVLFTAGTSGTPHGVVHSHAYTAAHRVQSGHWLQPRPGDVVWCTAAPAAAPSIWNTLLGPWSHGAEVVMHPGGTNAAERVDLIEQLGVTILSQTPLEYRRMLELDELRPTVLRHAVSTGAPLVRDVTAGFRDATGLTIHDGYGQTENAVLIASTPDAKVPDGAIGRVTPGHDVAIVDEAGEQVRAGDEGDIALRGKPATLFLGYLGAPATAAAAARGEWYVTGDRGICDENGIFWFAGRSDDTIVSGGARIRAFEVENRLLAHPAVADVAVVGRPDPGLGQVARALVVARPTTEPVEDLEAELVAYGTGGDAADGLVLETELVAALPLGPGGTVDRAALRSTTAGHPRATRLVDPGPGTAAVEGSHERPLRLVLGGAQAVTQPDGRLRFDAAPLEAGSGEHGPERSSRRAARSLQRAQERERKQAAEAERREQEQRRKVEAEARRAEEERRRKEADEQRKREAAERKAEEQRQKAEAMARKEQEAAARRAAKESERLEREAQRAEEERLLAAARERKRLSEERRQAEEKERKAALARQRVDADARRKQEEQERKAAASRARAEAKAAAARSKAEDDERRRSEDAARRAERDAAQAEAARLETAERERLVQEAASRRAAQEAAAAEAARLEARDEERQRREAQAAEDAESRRQAEVDERRRQEEAARAAEREAARAESARLRSESEERQRQEELDRKVAEAQRNAAEADAKRLAEAKRRADEQERQEAEERRRAEAEAQALRRAALRPPRPAPKPEAPVTPATLETAPVAVVPPSGNGAAQRAADEERRRAQAERQRVAADAKRGKREPTQDADEDEPEVSALMIERIGSYGIHADPPPTRDS